MPKSRVRAGMKSSPAVVCSDCGGWRGIVVHGWNEQLVIVHWMAVTSEVAHWRCRYELMEKSSARGNCSGADSSDASGLKVMIGREQSEREMIRSGWITMSF